MEGLVSPLAVTVAASAVLAFVLVFVERAADRDDPWTEASRKPELGAPRKPRIRRSTRIQIAVTWIGGLLPVLVGWAVHPGGASVAMVVAQVSTTVWYFSRHHRRFD